MEQFSRTELLIGRNNASHLYSAKVAVFGLGGVGSYVAEALARAGIGTLMLVDNDVVTESNINRQLIATHSAIGKLKVEIMAKRIADINPNAVVLPKPIFYTSETADKVDFTGYDYIVDAIDTVSSKLLLIENAKSKNIPIISAMGAGNKLDATAFKVADIYQTKVCPLARVMRRELKKRNIDSLKVVYSEEEVVVQNLNETDGKSPTPASVSFVPPVMGLIIAGEVIKDIAFK